MGKNLEVNKTGGFSVQAKHTNARKYSERNIKSRLKVQTNILLNIKYQDNRKLFYKVLNKP